MHSMDAKVSPFTAFLTELHEKISAIEPPVANQIQDWNRIPAGQTNYLNAQGQPMDARDFDRATRQLLNDYKLIQYDIMAGKHYLQGTGFNTTPTRHSDAARQKAKEQARQEEQSQDKDSGDSTSSAN